MYQVNESGVVIGDDILGEGKSPIDRDCIPGMTLEGVMVLDQRLLPGAMTLTKGRLLRDVASGLLLVGTLALLRGDGYQVDAVGELGSGSDPSQMENMAGLDFGQQALSPANTLPGLSQSRPDCTGANQGMPFRNQSGNVYQCKGGEWSPAQSNVGQDGTFYDPRYGKLRITEMPEDLAYPETLKATAGEQIRYNPLTGKREVLVQLSGVDGMGVLWAEVEETH